MTRITIVYDNEAALPDLTADWGFACLVEAYGHRILFDTGAKGDILLDNMKKLNISPADIDEIFISHDHWDHTGGLKAILKAKPLEVYLPDTFEVSFSSAKVVRVKKPLEIHDNIHSTGELGGIEQSLVVRSGDGVLVIAGCSHPGVEAILGAAEKIGKPKALIGGLHGFDQFELLDPLEKICPTHCTQHIATIVQRYPEKVITGGVGRIIEL